MNMTGDPNQQIRPSVFGYDCNYPSANPIGWTNLPTSPTPVIASNFTVEPKPNAQQPQFSFCSEPRPMPPIQFPFVTSVPPAQTVQTQHFGEFGNKTIHVPLRCKRKTDSPLPPASKQHITDEKMAEHMSQLHINSETVVTTETKPVREQRLYMCEEMRRLQQESVLPHSLLTRLNKPCTALVLWTPPPRIPLNNEAGVERDNNNEEGQPDNNVMEMDSN